MKIYMNTATIARFIERELANWPLAAQNYEALKMVQTKHLSVDGFDVKVQFNPARRVSTGAKIDRSSIQARPCFLCKANRPPEQKALRWGPNYEFLVNPYPIFARHLTIPELCHTPQTSKCRGPHMIEMVRDLEEYAIFYNGPLCGASAPDHMHFQACPKFELPLVEAIEKRMPATTESVELQASLGFPFGFYVVDINKKLEATMAIDTVRALYSVIDPSLNEEDYMTHEPKINIICFDSASVTRFVIIPRREHRPSNYGEGPGQMLISPASVDLGGVFITPRKEDFDAITADDIRRIYSECCYSEADIINVIDRI